MTIHPMPSGSAVLLHTTLSGLALWLRRRDVRPAASDQAETGARDDGPPAGWEPPVDLNGLRRLDPAVISQVHNRFFPDVYRYARYRLSDDALAEDVAGEVFTRLLETMPKGRGPQTNLRGWLMRTTANLVNDYYRAMYARPTEELSDLLASAQPGPADQFEAADEHRALHAALQKLTDEQAHVLALRFGSGLSLVETAQAIGKNANAIKALQFRAIGALRRELASVVDNPTGG